MSMINPTTDSSSFVPNPPHIYTTPKPFSPSPSSSTAPLPPPESLPDANTSTIASAVSTELREPSPEEYKACTFPVWYPLFTSHTLQSKIIPLPPSFISYLRSDCIIMPAELQQTKEWAKKGIKDVGGYEDGEEWGEEMGDSKKNAEAVLEGIRNQNGGDDSSSSEDEENENDDYETAGNFQTLKVSQSTYATSTSTTATAPTPTFPKLTTEITSTFQSLSPTLFPKLDWSSPQDAKWLNAQSLKCTKAEDVIRVLKGSDFIQFDLDVGLKLASEYQHNLILRPFLPPAASAMFRVFVTNHRQVLAISQRDVTQAFPFLRGKSVKSNVVNGINKLVAVISSVKRDIEKKKQTGGSDEVSSSLYFMNLHSYVVDVYQDSRGVWKVMDFNVWGEKGGCGSGLFTWLELEGLRSERSVIENDGGGEEEEEEEDDDVDEEFYSYENDDDDDDNDDDDNAPNNDKNTPSTSSPEFRILENERDIKADPLSSYRAPIDALFVASKEGFEEFKKKCVRPSGIK